jgi:small-conductance mechanosensitive channel
MVVVAKSDSKAKAEKETLKKLEEKIEDEPQMQEEENGSEEGKEAEDEDYAEYKDIKLKRSQRPWFRTFLMIIEILFCTVILMLPSVILGLVFDFEKYSIIKYKVGMPGFIPNGYREFFRWSVFITASYDAYVFASWAVGMISAITLGSTRLLKLTVSQKLRDFLKLVKRVQSYITVALWFFLVLAIGGIVLFKSNVPTTPGLASYIHKNNTEKALLAASFIALMVAFEKYIIQMITHAFHKESLSARIEKNNSIRQIIGNLYRCAKNMGNTVQLQSEFADAGLHELKIDELVGSKDHVHVASVIFKAMKQPDRDYLRPEDFRPFLGPTEAKVAFRALDNELRGKIDWPYFKATVLEIYAERDRIIDAVKQNGQVISRFDTALLVVIAVFAAIGVMSLFSSKSYTIILGFMSIALAFSFLIKDTVSRFSDAFRLIYIERAFDVGDVIKVDDTTYTVLTIRLFTSTFLRNSDKMITYAPNHVLSNKFIVNTKRLPLAVDRATITAYGSAQMSKVGELKSKINAFCKDTYPEYTGACNVKIKELAQGKVSIGIDVAFEPTSDEKVLARRNKFKTKLMEILGELQLSAEEPKF